MNALISGVAQLNSGAEWPVGLLVRLTLLLAGAWLLHGLLARANPRWRVLLWRGTAVSALLILVLTLAGPAISLSVLPPTTRSASAPVVTTSQPIIEAPAIVVNDVPNQPPIPSELNGPDSGVLAIPEAPTIFISNDRPGPVAIERTWTLAAVLWVIWAAGLLIGAMRETIALVRINRLRRRASPANAAITTQAASVAERFNCRKFLDVLVTSEVETPSVVGLWRPAILLPGRHGQSTCGDELPAVLAHELAHLKNADLAWNAILRTLTRVLWFHPLLWPARLAHAGACDAVCDAVAADFLGDVPAYCRTLARLALRANASLPATGLAMARASSARRRIEALERRVYATGLSHVGMLIAIAAGLVGAGLLGTTSLTRAQNGEEKVQPAGQEKAAATAADFSIAGHCYLFKIDDTKQDEQRFSKTPLAKVQVTLYVTAGPLDPIKKLAQATSDDQGRFEFTGLLPPRTEMHFDRRAYGMVAQPPGRPPAIWLVSSIDDPQKIEILLDPDVRTVSLTGKIINEAGKPVAGATIGQNGIWDHTVPGVQSAVTDQRGRFRIDDLAGKAGPPDPGGEWFRIKHPDYPLAEVIIPKLPAEAVFTLPAGCELTGLVQDETTGKPAANIVVSAESIKTVSDDAWTHTDANGHFRLVVDEGSYNIVAEAKDRVCIALVDQQCQNGQSLELPPIRLTAGGWIEGQVLNSATRKPVVDTQYGPVTLGLFGPSYPLRKHGKDMIYYCTLMLTEVDAQGRFKLRAAAGDNYPYFANTHGRRLVYDTLDQPPVVVKDGETTHFDMLIDPIPTPQERIKAAMDLVAGLPKDRDKRVAVIISQFGVQFADGTNGLETWCILLRELVSLGPDAVPQICSELDKADSKTTLRSLGFVLRAIGDPRAVPALIRAIPKTLPAGGGDFGFSLDDPDLGNFMSKHDVDENREGDGYVNSDGPLGEILAALHRLTGQDLHDKSLLSITRSEDPNGLAIQQRLFRREAELWQSWWEAHWSDFIKDGTYSKVNLPAEQEVAVRPILTLGPKSKVGKTSRDDILSPPGEEGSHFLDLDTGLEPDWPTDIAENEAAASQGELALWAAQNGVDLMGVTYRPREGKPTYALRALNMRLWEISLRDAEKIESWLKSGKLPEMQPAGDLLLHQDKTTGGYDPQANAAFLYITREGGVGIIQVTDRVTVKVEPAAYTLPRPGTGSNLGVRFDQTQIVP